MRTDKGSFKLRPGVKSNTGIWPSFRVEGMTQMGTASQSGRERNHLFVNSGDQFADISGIAGADSPADTRAFAILDYDRDGWPDMVMANANAPLMELYRNTMGEWAGGPQRNRMIAIRFVGANRAASPAENASCRDGYGALVTVSLGDETRIREHRCGEGLAAQNSATMLIGVGHLGTVPSVTVRWPSGREQSTANVNAGTLLTVYEDPTQSPSGQAFVAELYAARRGGAAAAAAEPSAAEELRLASVDLSDAPKLVMYVTMATWCAACRGELPELEHLQRTLGDELWMFGVPVDDKDDPEKLRSYAAAQTPAYKLLDSIPREDVAKVKAHIKAALAVESLPATVLTDSNGRVLLTRLGAPSVSELRKLLRTE